VPDVEGLAVRAHLAAAGISGRVWVEALLTHLCCPEHTHPELAAVGLTVEGSVAATRLEHRLGDEDEFDARIPELWIPAIDPGLALAGLDLPALLACTWHWVYSLDRKTAPSIAARLAAFVTSFADDPRTWQDVHRKMCGETGLRCSPRDYDPTPIELEALPWIALKKGVAT
jgi:hypothetical protein